MNTGTITKVEVQGDRTEGEGYQSNVTVPPVPLKSEISILPHYDHLGVGDENVDFTLTHEKTEGTGGTEGTTAPAVASGCTPTKNGEGTRGTNLDDAANPLHDADENVIKTIDFDGLNTPLYLVENDWFILLGCKRRPGVWYCYETEGTEKKPPAKIAIFVCSPLRIIGITNTEDGQFFGRLLSFVDSLGRWRKWAMPMELLRGSCEELRGELLAGGMEISTRDRARLTEYLQWRKPRDVWIAATRTGWTTGGNAFVFRDRVIGDEKVHFQSESASSGGTAKTGGNFNAWQRMAAQCAGNPVLVTSLSVSLSGALMAKVHRDSGGIHWIGDSSTGKTTALIVGASIWGGSDFIHTWRATGNGLEGVAAQTSDTCLCLDEISEADPREVGAIVYSLGNGVGKTRANRIGSARSAHRWRLSLLSTGERSLDATMQEGGKQAKSGQLVRLLNVPSSRNHGAFDDLHDFKDGRELSNFFKNECGKHYGHAGVKFVEHILAQDKNKLSERLADIEPLFKHGDEIAARAASRFALYALAGELAIEAGILPWQGGEALQSCLQMFAAWQDARGDKTTETKQILQNVLDYLVKYGDTKFTDKADDMPPKSDRSGWYTDRAGVRVYLFSSAGIKEAGGNFDLNRVLDALDKEGWIVEHDHGKRSKQTRVTGGAKHKLYYVLPPEDELVPSVPSQKTTRVQPEAANIEDVPRVPSVPPEKTKVESKNSFEDKEFF